MDPDSSQNKGNESQAVGDFVLTYAGKIDLEINPEIDLLTGFGNEVQQASQYNVIRYVYSPHPTNSPAEAGLR